MEKIAEEDYLDETALKAKFADVLSKQTDLEDRVVALEAVQTQMPDELKAKLKEVLQWFIDNL